MQVRSFRLSDYAEVIELLSRTLSEACFDETMEAFARQLSLDSDLVLVAQVNQQIAGVVIGTIDNHEGYYYRLAVHQQHRGKGIGKTLISAMRQRFTNRKVQKIMVTADQHNQPILPLYESLGYSPCCEKTIRNLKIVNG